jgi:hypothetical protein
MPNRTPNKKLTFISQTSCEDQLQTQTWSAQQGYSLFLTLKHRHLFKVSLRIIHEPLLFCITFTTNPSLIACQILHLQRNKNLENKVMHAKHSSSMHFYITHFISFTKCQTNFKILSYFLCLSKNQPTNPP